MSMTSPTDNPRDSRALAKLLVARYGVQATAHANYQALKARDRGDRQSMERWLWIAGATREILGSEPDENEGLENGDLSA